jgi:hypothetical protein
MRSSRTEKSVSHFRLILFRECVQEQTMWHSHICAVESMQRMGSNRLGINL